MYAVEALPFTRNCHSNVGQTGEIFNTKHIVPSKTLIRALETWHKFKFQIGADSSRLHYRRKSSDDTLQFRTYDFPRTLSHPKTRLFFYIRFFFMYVASRRCFIGDFAYGHCRCLIAD